MTADGESRDAAVDRVRSALADAAVGRDVLYASLTDLDAATVSLDGHTVRVTISLPVPHEGVRAALERDVQAAVGDLDGVSSVTVDWRPAAADRGERVDLIPDVKNVVAVASGKGGVGKSTVAVNLATALADAGAAVGLLDADVYGPNAPKMLGLSDATPATTRGDDIVPREAHGVRVMSMGFVVGEDDPVIWRGSMVADLITQFVDDVAWGDLDYLVVDLPPGTGDAQMTLVEHLPVAGAVLVTTPQDVAVDDARLGLEQFARYGVPVLGIVENMHQFECPDCGEGHAIFGEGGARSLAEEYNVPVLAELPLDPMVGVHERDEDERGVSIPVVGRVAMPRTREERERGGRLPPVSLREDGGEVRDALRLAATRTAARLDQLAVGE
ncbi:Mrp/NBP35 family ATP-binding protein [Halobacteriaceae archaeon GCM10025711]